MDVGLLVLSVYFDFYFDLSLAGYEYTTREHCPDHGRMIWAQEKSKPWVSCISLTHCSLSSSENRAVRAAMVGMSLALSFIGGTFSLLESSISSMNAVLACDWRGGKRLVRWKLYWGLRSCCGLDR